MDRVGVLVAARMAFGLLGFSALVTEAATLVERDRFDAVVFSSYFTVECNALTAAVLLIGAVAASGGWCERLGRVRAAVTVYVCVVGLGFAALLSGLPDTEFTAVPWDNVVLHYVMPLAMAVDYLVDRPRARIARRQIAWWLVFPAVYVAYTLIRGASTGWYPYPFLDPGHRGAGAVSAAVSGLLVLTLALSWAARLWSGPTGRQPAHR